MLLLVLVFLNRMSTTAFPLIVLYGVACPIIEVFHVHVLTICLRCNISSACHKSNASTLDYYLHLDRIAAFHDTPNQKSSGILEIVKVPGSFSPQT